MLPALEVRTILAELGISRDTLRSRSLPVYEEATMLEVAEVGPNGREHLLTPVAATSWREMKAAARRDGVELFIVSAFRTVSRQAEIIRHKLASGQRIEDIIVVSAPPGYSEHHAGLAVDIGTPDAAVLEGEFEATLAFAWLCAYAENFGSRLSYPRENSYGYQYEPWHWCHSAA